MRLGGGGGGGGGFLGKRFRKPTLNSLWHCFVRRVDVWCSSGVLKPSNGMFSSVIHSLLPRLHGKRERGLGMRLRHSIHIANHTTCTYGIAKTGECT